MQPVFHIPTHAHNHWHLATTHGHGADSGEEESEIVTSSHPVGSDVIP